jgi:hypothetical protein
MTSSGDASHGSSGDAQITASCSSNDGIIGHGDWDAIRNKIYDILESYPGTKDDMTSISLLRPVSSPCDADNPIIVYVSVDYESKESGRLWLRRCSNTSSSTSTPTSVFTWNMARLICFKA